MLEVQPFTNNVHRNDWDLPASKLDHHGWSSITDFQTRHSDGSKHVSNIYIQEDTGTDSYGLKLNASLNDTKIQERRLTVMHKYIERKRLTTGVLRLMTEKWTQRDSGSDLTKKSSNKVTFTDKTAEDFADFFSKIHSIFKKK